MKISIYTRDCDNCCHKGDNFTDGTFYCTAKETHFEEDKANDCEDFFYEVYDEEEE